MDLSEEGESQLNAKAFSAMTNLKMLKINNVYLSGDLEYLSDQLRFLNWHGYPLKCLPPNFNPESILELELPNSCIEHLWEGSKVNYKFSFIDVRLITPTTLSSVLYVFKFSNFVVLRVSKHLNCLIWSA